MGDPFSVAGTAVGITSLGIQVCQIVSRYYSQYRGIHVEINDIVNRANILEAYLKSLARVRQKIETSDIALSVELQQALQACEDVLARLKVMAKRCGEIKAPGSLSDRIRMAQKRLLWPFKRDTLMDLQNTLVRFQSNLGLALQLSGLDFEADQLRELVAETKAIHKEIDSISTAQVARVTQLSNSMSDLSKQLASTHVTTSHDLNTMSAAQKDHTALVQAGFDGLLNQSKHLLEHFAVMQQKLERLVPAAPMPNPTGTFSILDTAANKQAARTVKTSFSQSLHHYNANIPRNQSRNLTKLTNCLCRGTRTSKIIARVGKWIAIYSESAYEHALGCPCFSHPDVSKNVGFRFTLCNGTIRKCVHAGFQQSRIQGWSTISPFLRYRAVVPRNSGVFKAIEDAQKAVRKSCCDPNTSYQKEAEEILSSLIRTMRHCFNQTAHPTDVSEYGNSILESIMWLLRELIDQKRIEDRAIVFNFLDACHTLGLFTADAEGAMMWWQQSVVILPEFVALDIFCFLPRRLVAWKLDLDSFHERERRLICDTVSEMLVADDIGDGFLEKDCLHGAILRRSELDFQKCIQTSDPGYLTSCLTRSEYAVPLLCWGTGLEILTSSESDDLEIVQASLWTNAITNLHVDSLRLMIDSQWKVSIKHWFSLNYETFWTFSTDHDDFPEWSDDGRYRPIFQSLAAKLSKQLEFDCNTKSSSGGISLNSKEIPFYHTPYLRLTTAVDLWNAGHQNIDTVHPEAFGKRTNETPLWILASGWPFHSDWNHLWSVVCWLVEKGANIFWSYPFFVTTPAHILVRKAVESVVYHEASENLQSVRKILASSEPDRCSCYCSLSGCYVVSCAISKYTLKVLDSFHRERRVQMEKFWVQTCSPWLFFILDQKENSKGMTLAVIRLLTFEELSLTHTCCNRYQYDSLYEHGYTPLEEYEIEEIHEIEKNDMILLDKLMEEFENEWEGHSGTFTSFIKQVWEPKMEALRAEQKDLHEIYQETGVKLYVSERDTGESLVWEISEELGEEE